MRIFNDWLATMRKSINGYTYYVDFPKGYENVEKIKNELDILNELRGSNNIENEFRDILTAHPEVVKCIPILLAVREKTIYAQDVDGAFNYKFKKLEDCIDKYIVFMKKTGLFDLLSNHIINNLYDYVLGVETGLNTNGRKNRGGHQMEDLVEGFIKKTGKEYYKEMYALEVAAKWGVDLSSITADGTSDKRFDFVVKTPSNIYVIETNFYTSQGSKLNETARSYKMLAEEAKPIPNFEFVWITDGGGWKNARRILEETFNTMEHLYNITDMENGVLSKVFR